MRHRGLLWLMVLFGAVVSTSASGHGGHDFKWPAFLPPPPGAVNAGPVGGGPRGDRGQEMCPPSPDMGEMLRKYSLSGGARQAKTPRGYCSACDWYEAGQDLQELEWRLNDIKKGEDPDEYAMRKGMGPEYHGWCRPCNYTGYPTRPATPPELAPYIPDDLTYWCPPCPHGMTVDGEVDRAGVTDDKGALWCRACAPPPARQERREMPRRYPDPIPGAICQPCAGRMEDVYDSGPCEDAGDDMEDDEADMEDDDMDTGSCGPQYGSMSDEDRMCAKRVPRGRPISWIKYRPRHAWCPPCPRLVEIPLPEMRLADGPDASSGRVEININGEWGTICNDGFNWGIADVACRAMGFSGAYGVINRTENDRFNIPDGTGRIWLDGMYCPEHARDLWKCIHNEPGVTDCSHDKDAALWCTNDASYTPPVCTKDSDRNFCQQRPKSCMMREKEDEQTRMQEEKFGEALMVLEIIFDRDNELGDFLRRLQSVMKRAKQQRPGPMEMREHLERLQWLLSNRLDRPEPRRPEPRDNMERRPDGRDSGYMDREDEDMEGYGDYDDDQYRMDEYGDYGRRGDYDDYRMRPYDRMGPYRRGKGPRGRGMRRDGRGDYGMGGRGDYGMRGRGDYGMGGYDRPDGRGMGSDGRGMGPGGRGQEDRRPMLGRVARRVVQKMLRMLADKLRAMGMGPTGGMGSGQCPNARPFNPPMGMSPRYNV